MTALREAPTPPAPAAAARPRRLHGLTGLRYFAAIAVVLVHVEYTFANARSLTIAGAYGYIGVTFFYLLSGFVLTWSYSGQPATRFWWGRIARIVPLQITLMLVAFTVLAPQEKVPGPRGRIEDLLLLQAWDPRPTVYYGGNGVSWSLSCEMFFYLLFPAAILLVRRLTRRGVTAAATATLTVMLTAPVVVGWSTPLTAGGLVTGQTYYWLFYVFPPYRFGEFFLGMLLARATTLGLRVRRPLVTGSLAVAGLAALTLAVTHFTLHTGNDLARPLVDLAAVPFFALLILATTSSEVARAETPLGTGLPVLLGEWSFALFLVHKPVFLLSQRWGLWNNPGGWAGLGMFLAYLALATAVAAVVHYLVERPVERFLRTAPRRWRSIVGRNGRRPAAAE